MVHGPLTEEAFVLKEGMHLCPFQLSNAKAFFQSTQNNLSHLSPWMPEAENIRSEGMARHIMEKAIRERRAGEALHCGLWDRENLIGYAGLVQIRRQVGNSLMGYWLDKDATGQGFATLACRTLLAYGFQELGLQTLAVHTAKDNKKSCAIPMRLGFTLRSVRENAEIIQGQAITHNIYQLDRKDWNKHEEVS